MSTTVTRAGQNGYFCHTELNKKIYCIRKKDKKANCQTKANLTKKGVTIMGGLVHYGEVDEDWLMLKRILFFVSNRKMMLTSMSIDGRKEYSRPSDGEMHC